MCMFATASHASAPSDCVSAQTLNSLFESCFDEAQINCAPSPIRVFVKTSITSTASLVDPTGKTLRVDATLMNQGHECTGTNNQCNNTVLNAANKYECECTNSYIPTGQNAPPQTCLEAGKPGTYCTSAGQGCEVKLIFTAQRGLLLPCQCVEIVSGRILTLLLLVASSLRFRACCCRDHVNVSGISTLLKLVFPIP